MAEALGQRDEIALGVDHDLLHMRGALLEQAAQQMRLARPGIALHEQAGRQQFLEVEHRRSGRPARRGGGPHVDVDLHRPHHTPKRRTTAGGTSAGSPSEAGRSFPLDRVERDGPGPAGAVRGHGLARRAPSGGAGWTAPLDPRPRRTGCRRPNGRHRTFRNHDGHPRPGIKDSFRFESQSHGQETDPMTLAHPVHASTPRPPSWRSASRSCWCTFARGGRGGRGCGAAFRYRKTAARPAGRSDRRHERRGPSQAPRAPPGPSGPASTGLPKRRRWLCATGCIWPNRRICQPNPVGGSAARSDHHHREFVVLAGTPSRCSRLRCRARAAASRAASVKCRRGVVLAARRHRIFTLVLRPRGRSPRRGGRGPEAASYRPPQARRRGAARIPRSPDPDA